MRNFRQILLLLLAVAATTLIVAASAVGSQSRRATASKAESLFVPGPKAVTGGLVVGLADGASGFGGQSTAPTMTAMMNGTDTKWFRDSIMWSKVEPRKGVFNFEFYDHYMLIAGQHHLHIVAQLANTPKWAGPNPFSMPSNPQLYAQYVAAVVKRYGVGGTFWKLHPALKGSAITTVELWNEPFFTNGNAGKWAPGLYAQMVKDASVAVHAIAPSTKLLLESDMEAHLNGVWTWWTDALYKAMPNLNKYFQGVAIHDFGKDVTHLSPIVAGKPYPNFGRVRRIQDLRRQFISHGAGNKPMWIMESGWPTCTVPNSDCVTPAQQAANLRTLIGYVHGPWKSWVQSVFVYRYQDTTDSNTVQGGYGLLYNSGAPKPALSVYEPFAASSVN